MVVDRVELAGDQARVIISRGLRGAPVDAVRRAASFVADALAGVASNVALVQTSPAGGSYEQSFTAEELARSTIVDYLFEGLESEGIEVRGIEYSHTAATLYVSRLPTRRAHARAALVVLDAAPTPVETVRMVAVEVDFERVSLSRDEVRRSITVDSMFDDLEAHGFTVESIDITRRTATVAVSSRGTADASAYHVAAWIVAESGAAAVDEVTVIGLRGGHEESRLTVHVSDGNIAIAASDEGAPMDADAAASDRETRIFEELEAEGIETDAVHFAGRTATVFVTARRFRQLARNVGRAARVVANNSPEPIEEIAIVATNKGVVLHRVTILRADLEHAVALGGSPEEVWADATFEGANISIPEDAIVPPGRYPVFRWSVSPETRQFIGDATKFVLYQVWAKARAELELARGLSVSTILGIDIYNNFDQALTGSDSRLPRVRSDVREYLQQGCGSGMANVSY